MRRNRVLFAMHLPPPVHGAAMVGQYIKNSALITSAIDPKYINLSTSRTVDEIGRTGIRKWIRYLGILKSLLINLIKFKPTLLYITLTATGIGFYKDALLVMVAKLWKKKIILHFHNKGVKNSQERIFDNILYNLIFKNTKVILLAPQLYDDIKKYVQEKNVSYCGNGIPEVTYKSVLSKKRTETVHLLFLSNLIASKGILILLESCKILKEKGLNFKCSFVGGPGDLSVKDFTEAISRLNLSDKVSYLGKKFDEEKYEIYNQADIFVLPTFYHNECFPLVLLEAMQFSLPLVSTAEGGIPDIIDEGINGFMVLPRNAIHLAKKLELLIADEELRTKMGKNAYDKYRSNYTLELFEHRFLSILNKELI